MIFKKLIFLSSLSLLVSCSTFDNHSSSTDFSDDVETPDALLEYNSEEEVVIGDKRVGLAINGKDRDQQNTPDSLEQDLMSSNKPAKVEKSENKIKKLKIVPRKEQNINTKNKLERALEVDDPLLSEILRSSEKASSDNR